MGDRTLTPYGLAEAVRETRGPRRCALVAREMGVAESTLWRIERGLRVNPDDWGKAYAWFDDHAGQGAEARS